MGTEWYYAKGEVQNGPVSMEHLKELATAGQLLPTDTVWSEGMPKWVSASGVAELWPAKPKSAPSSNSLPPVIVDAPPAVNTAVIGQTILPLTAITVGFATSIVAAVIGPKSVLLTVPVLVLLGLWLLYAGFRVSRSLPAALKGFTSPAGRLAFLAKAVGITPVPLAVIGPIILLFLYKDTGDAFVRIVMVLSGVICLAAAGLSRLMAYQIMDRKPIFTTKYLKWAGGIIVVFGIGLGVASSLYENRRHSYMNEANARRSSTKNRSWYTKTLGNQATPDTSTTSSPDDAKMDSTDQFFGEWSGSESGTDIKLTLRAKSVIWSEKGVYTRGEYPTSPSGQGIVIKFPSMHATANAILTDGNTLRVEMGNRRVLKQRQPASAINGTKIHLEYEDKPILVIEMHRTSTTPVSAGVNNDTTGESSEYNRGYREGMAWGEQLGKGMQDSIAGLKRGGSYRLNEGIVSAGGLNTAREVRVKSGQLLNTLYTLPNGFLASLFF